MVYAPGNFCSHPSLYTTIAAPHAIHNTAAGTDLKSILLNASSICFILVPFVWYNFHNANRNAATTATTTTASAVAAVVVKYGAEGYAAFSVLLFAAAYLTPPVGWRRPHPYSDDPRNVPTGLKQN